MGIYPLNSSRISRNIIQKWKPYPPTATPREPRAASRLAFSILHLTDRQTASSRKLEAVISQLGRTVCGALAGRGLGEEAVINLQSESKETSENTAKDQRHFNKGRGLILGGL